MPQGIDSDTCFFISAYHQPLNDILWYQKSALGNYTEALLC